MPEFIPEQNITLDDLALMMHTGFKEVRVDITAVHARIDKFEEHVDARFDAFEKGTSLLEAIVNRNYENRLNRVEKKFQIA